MSTIGVKVTRIRFDSAKILQHLEKGEAKALSRIGAFIWRRAQTSMRYRKRVSEPGQPPSAHTGRLRQSIKFAFDNSSRSVVIGPELTSNQIVFDTSLSSRLKVGSILEFGGQGSVIEEAIRVNGQLFWARRDLRKRGSVALLAALRQNAGGHKIHKGKNFVVPAGRNRQRTYTVAPRPFMGPALTAEIAAGKMPSAFSYVISK